MKRKMKILFLAALLLFNIGCSNTSSSKQVSILSPLAENYVYMPFQNFNYTIYSEFATVTYFSFPLISMKEITEEELSIDLHINTKYTYSIEEMEKDDFPYYLYQCYKKTDWEKLLDFYKAEDHSDYIQYNEKYISSYKAFDQNSLPELHKYRITVVLDLNSKQVNNEEIKTADFKIGNEVYQFNLGSIVINYEANDEFSKSDDMICDTLAISELSLLPTSTGVITVPEISFDISNDIILKNISIYKRPDVTLESAALYLDDKEEKIEFDNVNAIKIASGSKLKMDLSLRDKQLKNKLDYESLYYIVFEYEVSGKTYRQKLDMSANIEKTLYEYVYEQQGNTNLADYYLKYLSYVDLKEMYASVEE